MKTAYCAIYIGDALSGAGRFFHFEAKNDEQAVGIAKAFAPKQATQFDLYGKKGQYIDTLVEKVQLKQEVTA